LVLELCDGSLKEFVDNAVKKQQIINSRSILSQVVVGLSYLHGQKIIHKDLKPSNILYQHKEHNIILWKLCDFGYSRKMHQNRDEFDPTKNLGTEGYIAPELWGKKIPTFATDIWALGAVAYFVVSNGKYAYDIPEVSQMFQQYLIVLLKSAPGLKEIADDWAAADLICRLLHYQPENRPSIFTIIYHPFFALKNEMTKKHLAFKIFDFWLNKHNGKTYSPMNTYFKENSVKEWYEQYEKELGSEGDQEELERISNFVIVFLRFESHFML
jgi:serine/threonine protein kinase